MTSPNYAVIVYTSPTSPMGHTDFGTPKYAEIQQRIKADLDAGLPVILPAGWQLFITSLPQGKTYNIDARGATPAEVEKRVKRDVIEQKPALGALCNALKMF